jgi:hypothetical protein
METEPTEEMLKLIWEAQEDSDESFRTSYILFIDLSRIHMHSTWSRVSAMSIATRVAVVTVKK